MLHSISQLNRACTSGSALRRQVTRLSFSDRSEYGQQLAAMRPLGADLPRLRCMHITPSAEDIQTLLAQKSREQTLADLKAAFSPQLRELHLYLTEEQHDGRAPAADGRAAGARPSPGSSCSSAATQSIMIPTSPLARCPSMLCCSCS